MEHITNFKIINILDKDKLNNFIQAQKHPQFLQSWEWGEFQKSMGYKIFRIGVLQDKEIVGVATLIKKNLGAGRSYLFCPRGPIFDFRSSDV